MTIDLSELFKSAFEALQRNDNEFCAVFSIKNVTYSITITESVMFVKRTDLNKFPEHDKAPGAK